MPSPLGNKAGALAAGAGVLLLVCSPGLDQPLKAWIMSWKDCPLTEVWAQIAYYAGLGGVQIGAMVVLALIAWRLKRSKALHAWLWAGAAVLISGAATQILKHLLGRPRPRTPLHHLQRPRPLAQS